MQSVPDLEPLKPSHSVIADDEAIKAIVYKAGLFLEGLARDVRAAGIGLLLFDMGMFIEAPDEYTATPSFISDIAEARGVCEGIFQHILEMLDVVSRAAEHVSSTDSTMSPWKFCAMCLGDAALTPIVSGPSALSSWYARNLFHFRIQVATLSNIVKDGIGCAVEALLNKGVLRQSTTPGRSFAATDANSDVMDNFDRADGTFELIEDLCSRASREWKHAHKIQNMFAGTRYSCISSADLGTFLGITSGPSYAPSAVSPDSPGDDDKKRARYH